MKAELRTCRAGKKGDHADLNGSCFEELMENRTKEIKWGFIKGQQMSCFYMSQG